jgi:hypothetical protein
MGPVRDQQAPLDFGLSSFQGLKFFNQRIRIHHNASCYQTKGRLMEDPRRNQVKDELFLATYYSVASVGPSLIADYQIGVLRHDVDDLALPLVPPLSTHNDNAAAATTKH